MKVYISGRITDPDKRKQRVNMTRFFIAEAELRNRGYDVFNPASLEVGGATWEYYLARDIVWIVENRPIIYLLYGWEESKGAKLEVEVGRLLGLTFWYQGKKHALHQK